MSYLFPLAFMANMFAMTVLLIVLGLTGKSAMAAEVGIVQGATLALFYAFSANARSLILNKSATVSANSIMFGRVLLVAPLALISYWLSVSAVGVSQMLAIILILRRVTEWLSEVHLSEMERLDNRPFAIKYFIAQSLLLFFAIGWLLANFTFPYLGLIVWHYFHWYSVLNLFAIVLQAFPLYRKNCYLKYSLIWALPPLLGLWFMYFDS